MRKPADRRAEIQKGWAGIQRGVQGLGRGESYKERQELKRGGQRSRVSLVCVICE